MVPLRCLLVLSLVSLGVNGATVFTVSTEFSNPGQTYHSGSLAGGTMLFVDGTNLMAGDPGQIKIMVGTGECLFDAFLMRENYIECDTPRLNDTSNLVDIPITITLRGAPVTISPTANPKFTYSMSKTAIVYGVCPSQQTPLNPIAWYGAWRTEGDNSLYMEIRAANRHMEMLPEFSTYQSSDKSFIATNLGNNVAGEGDPKIRLAAANGFSLFHWTTKQYTIDGDMYYFKTLAEIDSVDCRTGSTAGGLLLTITGAGFVNDTSLITASIEGNPCQITSVTYDTLQCLTSERLLTEPGPTFEGSAGLRHHLWYGKSFASRTTLKDSDANITDIVPQAESFPPHNDRVDDPFVERWVGFFKPPRSGDYQFFISSDDACEVWLSTDTTSANKVKIIGFSGYTAFRDMLSRSETRSAPITLAANSLYYFEIWHAQYSGATHFSLGMKIPGAGSTAKNNMPSVQNVTIAPAQTIREVQRVTITGKPAGGKISFAYKGKSSDPVSWPSTGTEWSCGDLLKAMQPLGIPSLLCSINKSSGLAYDFTFNYAWTDIRGLITAIMSAATPAGLGASVVQVNKASKPLAGSYRLMWGNALSDNIPLTTSASALESQLNTNFTVYKGVLMAFGKADVDSVQMLFVFGDELNPSGPVPLMAVSSSVTGGPDDTIPIVTVTEMIPASTDKFWWSVPSEFFRTIESYPSVRVTVGKQPALCRGNCAFQYSAASPAVTAVTYTPKAVTITGVNFVNTCDMISITLGEAPCILNSNTVPCTTTSLTCTPGYGVVGTFRPRVLIKASGLAIVPATVASTTFSLSLVSVDPATGSVGGGTLLSISGTGFLPSLPLTGYTQVVKAGNSVCDVQTSSGNEITCITSRQTTDSTVSVTVGTVGGTVTPQTVTNTGFTYDLNSSPTISSVSPAYASTIVSTILTIKGKNFTKSKAGSVSVFVGKEECNIQQNDPTAVTDTSITCNLLGGPNGKSLLVVKIPGRGNAVFEDFPLIFSLDSITPSQGSTQGGTLLSLKGHGLSTRASQMLVLIVDQTHMCQIEGTPTEQEVKCRTPPPGVLSLETSFDTILHGRLFEDATCTASSCTFTYANSVTPVISSLSATSGLAGDSVSITGTTFGTNIASTTVMVGSVSATVTGVANGVVTFLVPNQEAGVYNVKLTFDELGTAKGSYTFAQNLAVTSVSPLTGSKAGTNVIIQGSGFSATAQVSFGGSPCKPTTITVASIQCRLAPGTATVKQGLRISQAYSPFTCSDLNSCGFLYDTAITPTVTGVSASGGVITVTGTGFTSNADVQLSIGGVSCPVSTTASTVLTSVCAPPSGPNPVEVLVLSKGYASGNPTLTTAFTAGGAVGEGSFAGGSTIVVTGSGLGPNTIVSVCGFPCPLTSSVYSSLQCTAPPLPSDFSQGQYNLIPTSQEVAGGFTSSSIANGFPLSSIFDSNYTTYYKSNEPLCYIQFDAKAGRKLTLSGVSLYPAEDSTTTYRSMVMANLTSSDDGVSWTQIHTFDVLLAGWNYWIVPVNQDLNDNYPIYKSRFFKLTFPTASQCRVSELRFLGVITQTDTSPTLSCPVVAFDPTTATTAPAGSFTYKATSTPVVTAISPKTGTIAGNTIVTFTGDLLAGVNAIVIDGVQCKVDTTVSTSTSAVCLTGKRDELRSPSIVVQTTTGLAALKGVSFLYADRWSSSNTWGGEVPPKAGETVFIPTGLTILLDICPPKLVLLLIEGGSLIVEDEKDLTLDAEYIVVKEGSFQVGTPTAPYQHQFTLTLHGQRNSPMMPIYGNKVLAVHKGVLDMHGIPRSVTWTSLAETVEAKTSSVKLQVATDWKVGETIVVASTSYEHTDAEQRVIKTIDPTGMIITVDVPFEFKHYAATETYGTQTIEMRAEVGLLTRNIRITGSQQGLDEEHGAHVMAYAPGDDKVVARISYVEIFNAGQAYSIGAYPFHFHMIGAVRNSFIKGNAIHHTFNRAVTIHGIQYLRVIDNVTYHTKGHTIFLEDGAESKNRIENNLVISVRRSWSRLNTDTTPAGIWCTNPDNYIIGNHVAGSDAYGIWYDFKANPTGPSATTLICPIGIPLGEFRNNVGHSNGKYGFRLFHGHVPRMYPCLPAMNPDADDPWADNPPVTAYYRDFTGYKNHRNGAIADRVGDVRFINFKVADNLLAGIEVTYTLDTKPFTVPFVSGALIIGRSGNAELDVSMYGAVGFIGPQSDGLIAENMAFYNFDNSMYALGDESHSQACTTRDHGGRHNKLRGLTFGNSVKRVHWEIPRRSFFEIMDDSLTGTAGAFVAAFWPHLLWDPYCVYDEATYNGIVCDGTKKLRRVHMLELQPYQTFGLMQITIRRAAGDNIPLATPATGNRFLQAGTTPDYWWTSMNPYGGAQYHNVPKAWAVPMIMGTEYLVHWGTTPMDWMSMTMRIETFDDPSLWVIVRFNHTDHREMFEIRRGTLPAGSNPSAPGFVDPRLLPSQVPLTFTSPAGASTFDNVTALEFRTIMTGQPVTRDKSGDLSVKAYRCYGGHCTIRTIDENVTKENFERVWSDNNSWPSGAVPVTGERVEIPAEWTMRLDTTTAVLSFLEVNGFLVFDNKTSVTLNAEMIHVRKGKILSGTAQYPLLPNLIHQVVVHGTFTSLAYAFDPNIEVVNKAFIVTGEMRLFGARRKAWVRLVQNVLPGDTAIFVERTNWQRGDELVLTSSSYFQNETETAVITDVTGAYNLITGVDDQVSIASDPLWIQKQSTRSFGRNGRPANNEIYDNVDPKLVTKITLARPLQYYHSGTTLLIDGTPMDMRAEVGVLTSNVIIRGTENGWTCNFVVADFVDYSVINSNPILRSGSVTLDSISIDYCGQNSTLRTGLRFESTTLPSIVSNSIVKRSQTYSVNIQNSRNIRLIGNTFFYAVRFGVFVQKSSNLVLDGNLMVNVTQRLSIALPFDKPTGFVICPEERWVCNNVVVMRNVAAGYALLGFADGATSCGQSPTFYDNVAHSGPGGWITSNIGSDCIEMTGFTAYFNSETAVVGSTDCKKMTLKGLKLAENFNGYGGNMGGEADGGNVVRVLDSLFVGKTGHSVCDSNECWTPQCGNRRGIIFSTYLSEAKQWTINGKLKLPMYNVSKEAVFNAEFFFDGLTFANFNSTDTCQANITAIAANELSPDYTPVQTFTRTKLVNVSPDSVFYMADPDPMWANLIFCGEMPCTGLRNVVVKDKDGGLMGNEAGGIILPNNPGITIKDACTFIPKSNGYICQKSPLYEFDYGVIMFENLDIDTRDVTISPIYITSEDNTLNVNSTHYYNKLNSFMSHIWDGFYVGTNRLGRFPTTIGLNRKFNVTFTATAPVRMRYQLQGWSKWTDSVVLTVNYKEPYSVKVKVNGTEQWYLPFGQLVNLTSPSGTNRWLHVERMIQFIIRPGDIVELTKVDCIQVSVRINMTTDQFFAGNGETEFVDRLAAVLGIPPYRIRVANIKAGSTIVEAWVNADESLTGKRASSTNFTSAAIEELTKINNALLSLASNGSLVLNGPVLSVQSNLVTVAPSIPSTSSGNTTTGPITVIPPGAGGDGGLSGAGNDSSDSSSLGFTWWVILLISLGSLFAFLLLLAFFLGGYFLIRKRQPIMTQELITQPAEQALEKEKDMDKQVDITHEIVDMEQDEVVDQRPLSELRAKPGTPEKSAHVSVHW